MIIRGENMKALITDDSAFMRKMLSDSLVEAGYDEILEASDGVEAVEKYRKERPDIVLLDIVMHKKSGLDALKEIKAIDPNAKVIIISAMGQDKIINEAKRLGATDFVVKPIDKNKFREILANLSA